MIHLDAVTAHRAAKLALRDVTLQIPTATLTALIGPNGAGKSTLLGQISGRLHPSTGTVAVDGTVAEVLQTTAVDPQVRLTVHDVVAMGRYPSRGHLRPFRPIDREAVSRAIHAVDLDLLRHRTLDQLSGGQRQRALIAQGIAQDAEVLLLDEPAAGLDVRSQRRILEIMRAEVDRGRTVVFSTHHLPDASCADLVVALDRTLVCCDAPDIAMDRPDVRALFDPFTDAPHRTPALV